MATHCGAQRHPSTNGHHHHERIVYTHSCMLPLPRKATDRCRRLQSLLPQAASSTRPSRLPSASETWSSSAVSRPRQCTRPWPPCMPPCLVLHCATQPHARARARPPAGSGRTLRCCCVSAMCRVHQMPVCATRIRALERTGPPATRRFYCGHGVHPCADGGNKHCMGQDPTRGCIGYRASARGLEQLCSCLAPPVPGHPVPYGPRSPTPLLPDARFPRRLPPLSLAPPSPLPPPLPPRRRREDRGGPGAALCAAQLPALALLCARRGGQGSGAGAVARRVGRPRPWHPPGHPPGGCAAYAPAWRGVASFCCFCCSSHILTYLHHLVYNQ